MDTNKHAWHFRLIAYILHYPFNTHMIDLRPTEHLEYIARKHWFGAVTQMVVTAFLFMVPLFALPLEPFLAKIFPGAAAIAALLFASIYWMILLLFFYVEFLNYWLDVWVITSERIIDVEHYALFHREVSEFSTARVQDITIEVRGLVASLLKYGHLTVQTAGEQNFTIRNVAHPELVKDAIMRIAGKREI